MKKFTSLVLVASMVILSSCAAMFSGTKETITVYSDDKDATLYVNDRKIGTGSATVTIPKKKLKKTVLKAEKEGCSDDTTGIETAFDPVTLLGILIDWGIISVIVVDWIATGAVTQADETTYELNPSC